MQKWKCSRDAISPQPFEFSQFQSNSKRWHSLPTGGDGTNSWAWSFHAEEHQWKSCQCTKGKIKQLQLVWLCIFSCRPFEDTFENPHWRKAKQMQPSVPNSSDELIFVKRRALDGPFLDKNTGFRRAHRRAKFMFLIFFFLSKFAKKVKIEQN